MSLEAFRSDRLIVLRPADTAFAAARAMDDNHVGAVLVVNDHELVGIVTDRDVALAVVGHGRDPERTWLADIMTRRVATVDIGASAELVAETMRSRACRRVPLTEREELVGMVTLDDLVLHGLIDASTERHVIMAQLETGTRLKPEGALRPTPRVRLSPAEASEHARHRHEGRAELGYARLLRSVEGYTGLDRKRAERALVIVLGLVCSRIMATQATHLIAQLPSKLRPELESHLQGPDKRVTLDYILDRLHVAMGFERGEAEVLARAVCAAVAHGISYGEIEAVRSQLPADMKELFSTPTRASVDRDD